MYKFINLFSRIFRLIETGINKRIKKRFLLETKDENNENLIHSIEIETILLPLVILIVFYFIAFILLICELIFF